MSYDLSCESNCELNPAERHTGIDAFQEDPGYRKVSRVPLVKVSNVTALFASGSSLIIRQRAVRRQPDDADQ